MRRMSHPKCVIPLELTLRRLSLSMDPMGVFPIAVERSRIA